MVQGRALQENVLGGSKFERHSVGSVAPHVSSQGFQGHAKRLGLWILYNHYKIKAPALRNVLNGRYLILYKPSWEALVSRFCSLTYGADVCAPLAVARHLDFRTAFSKVEGGGFDFVGPYHPSEWLGSVLPSPQQKWQRPVPCQAPVGKGCSKYSLPTGSGAAATQGARQLSDMATFRMASPWTSLLYYRGQPLVRHGRGAGRPG